MYTAPTLQYDLLFTFYCISGIFTGSVYNDARLKRSGFPGESVTNGSVVVVKTHTSKPDRIKIFDRVVLIVRDPYEAILSFFNFRQTPGHVGKATPEDFDTGGLAGLRCGLLRVRLIKVTC